jgi:hydrogenase/urease accessory protein HupE
MSAKLARFHLSNNSMRQIIKLFAGLLFIVAPVDTLADVVRPALVEISINTNGTYRVEVRASIEALLTGINAKYKNTTEAPNAEAYDALRVLDANQLGDAFVPFKKRFTEIIGLRFDGERVPLTVTDTDIPERGYTKVPRMSLIVLEGQVDRAAEVADWYYPASFGDNAVRVRQVDEVNEQWHWSEWQWLRNDKRSEPFSLTEVFTQRPIWKTVWTYMVSGFEHILPKGLDHILFILGIFLLSQKFKPLLWQVTMFTVAHTITLGLAMAGYINLPSNIVEPLIALSIAYVGLENIWHRSLHNSRLFLVFAFGLLHGMGFASVLKDFGMPEDAFMTALISFNVGVEFGQLTVIALAFAVVGALRQQDYYRRAVIIPGSLAIAVTGLYWTVDRVSFV